MEATNGYIKTVTGDVCYTLEFFADHSSCPNKWDY